MDIKLFRKEIKANCIRWYDYKEHSNILIVGEDIDEWKEYLTTKGHKVNEAGPYDYIIIKEGLKEIEKVKTDLKFDGVILLYISNKYGLANTAHEEELFNKFEIERYLKKQGFRFYKFYYPLSNYDQANTIFSDDFLPESNNSKLLNNAFYDDDAVIKYNEIDAIKIATKGGKFVDYTNSYIVEIGNISPIKLITFNNSRKPEYRLITKVYTDKVVKEPVNEKAKAHIEEIKKNIESLETMGFDIIEKYEEGKIVSKYIPGKSLYDEIVDFITSNQVVEACELIEKWYQAMEARFENSKETFIDLLPENTFYRDGKYLIFDQEWKMENTPLEYIMFRAINNIYTYNPEVAGYISKDKMFKKVFLTDVEKYKEYEMKLQDRIVDSELAKTYDKEYKEKYKNTVPFEFYIKETWKEKIMKKLNI